MKGCFTNGWCVSCMNVLKLLGVLVQLILEGMAAGGKGLKIAELLSNISKEAAEVPSAAGKPARREE